MTATHLVRATGAATLGSQAAAVRAVHLPGR